jgi:hypothetical protein
MNDEKKLDHYYNESINAKNGKQFVYNLSNYVDCIVNSQEVAKIVETQILSQRESDLEKINQLRDTIFNDSKNFILKLKKQLKKIDNLENGIWDEISRYDNFVSGSLRISGDYTDNIIEFIRAILAKLLDFKPTKNIANKYAVYDSNNILVEWSWSKSLQFFDSEKRKIERISPAKAWYSWDKHLFLFYQLFTSYEDLWKKEYKRKDIFTLSGMSGAMKEIKGIIDGNVTTTYYYFSKEELSHHLAQFHIQLNLSNKENQHYLTNNTKTNFENNILKIGNKQISFKNNSRRALLLSLLIKDVNKKWSWDEWLEEVDGAIPDNSDKGKQQHYSACDGIQKQIAKTTGIIDFLVFNKQEVKIDSKYHS